MQALEFSDPVKVPIASSAVFSKFLILADLHFKMMDG